jgi:hypothetical protein
VRHSFRADAVGALTLYGLYELARGLVSADTADADGHAHRVVVLEGSLHLFVEANVQRDTTRVSTELGECDTASTNPPAVDVLLAGAEGATFLALVSRGLGTSEGSCIMQRGSVGYKLRQTTHSGKEAEDVQDNPDERHQQWVWA